MKAFFPPLMGGNGHPDPDRTKRSNQRFPLLQHLDVLILDWSEGTTKPLVLVLPPELVALPPMLASEGVDLRKLTGPVLSNVWAMKRRRQDVG